VLQFLSKTHELQKFIVNKMNDSKERGKGDGEGEHKIPTGASASSAQTPILLKALEDMLHNKIKQKKEEVHNKTKNIAENDKLSIEIDTLHWVLSHRVFLLEDC
jgi:hypothetical protein